VHPKNHNGCRLKIVHACINEFTRPLNMVANHSYILKRSVKVSCLFLNML